MTLNNSTDIQIKFSTIQHSKIALNSCSIHMQNSFSNVAHLKMNALKFCTGDTSQLLLQCSNKSRSKIVNFEYYAIQHSNVSNIHADFETKQQINCMQTLVLYSWSTSRSNISIIYYNILIELYLHWYACFLYLNVCNESIIYFLYIYTVECNLNW